VRFVYLLPEKFDSFLLLLSVTTAPFSTTYCFSLRSHSFLSFEPDQSTRYSMYSYATYVVLSLLAVFVILKRRAAASSSSSSLQPLKVQVIPPKSLPTVAPRPAKKPLPAPRPCLSPIVVRAQQSFKQLSLDDAVSDMDLLMSSFGSLSMKPGLPRPCCKSPQTICAPIMPYLASRTRADVGTATLTPLAFVQSSGIAC
jgi:hypothetical protein